MNRRGSRPMGADDDARGVTCARRTKPGRTPALVRAGPEALFTRGRHGVVGRSGQTKALSPVTALPTMRVFISRVPSNE
jgi:hypothetical protein